MIVLTCGDASLSECAVDSWRKFSLVYGNNDDIPSVKRSLKDQLEQESARLHPYGMDVYVMWSYDDAEVYRLCNAIQDLHARTITLNKVRELLKSLA